MGEGGYAAAPPASFPTVAKTATGPRVAHVARVSSTVTLDQEGAAVDKSEPSASEGMATLPQHTLPTPSIRQTTRPTRIRCVDPSCSVTFTGMRTMRRHAVQFHKMRENGKPATEAEHEAAVLAAAERTAWTRRHFISYARRRAVFKTVIERLAEEERRSGEQPDPVDPPDRARPAWSADVHRAFDCQQVLGPATEEEWIREQRPDDRAPVSYLHQLLRDKPTLPVQSIVDTAVRRYGWSDAMARQARLTVYYLEAARQQILDDIRALVPDTSDEESSLLFGVRVNQYLAQFPPRPE